VKKLLGEILLQSGLKNGEKYKLNNGRRDYNFTLKISKPWYVRIHRNKTGALHTVTDSRFATRES
jgi:hypothetical protein